MSLSDGFVSNGADVPANQVPTLSVNTRIGGSGVSSLASGTASFSENRTSIANNGEIGISEKERDHPWAMVGQHSRWG